MKFHEIIREGAATEGRFALQAPEDWMQGRSIFGGLQAALAIGAMQSLEAERHLRCLQTNFI